MLPYGLKVPTPSPYAAAHLAVAAGGMTSAAFDVHRAHLYEYNRLHYGFRPYPTAGMYHPHHQEALAHAFLYKTDPRARFIHEEPKPSQSYIGLIAMAILSHRDKKLVLSDIYQWILDNYPYFRSRGPGWRNSIRHNLSLNDCFIKAGRSANGKGHYWAIHPANVDDFQKGDFRRRRAQRRVRKHMGLAVPDDEDSPSPPPPASAPTAPVCLNTTPTAPGAWSTRVLASGGSAATSESCTETTDSEQHSSPHTSPAERLVLPPAPMGLNPGGGKKRLFDMESLLAPEPDTRSRAAKERRLSETTSEEAHSRVSDTRNHEKLNDTEDDNEDVSVDVDDDDDNNIDLCDAGTQLKQHAQRSQPRDATDELVDGVSTASGSPPPASHSPGTSSPLSVGIPSSHSTPITVAVGALHPAANRASWAASAMGASPVVSTTGWPETARAAGGSAFHPNPHAMAVAWTGMPSYPLVAAPYSALTAGGAESAQKWHQTFSRIMARSYDKNLKVEL